MNFITFEDASSTEELSLSWLTFCLIWIIAVGLFSLMIVSISLMSFSFWRFYAIIEFSGFLNSWDIQALISSRSLLAELCSSALIESEMSMNYSIVTSTPSSLYLVTLIWTCNGT